MSKYYLDTEFIEGFHKPLFGKKRHFIDLISIGVVSDDSREYYAISNEYNYKDADDWVKKNVILPLYLETVSEYNRSYYTVSNFHKHHGKSNKKIAEEVFEFCSTVRYPNLPYKNKNIEFYAYYADYDWVVLCSLFGRMIDLPTGFPMYCKDLKQIFDETANKYNLNKPEYLQSYMNCPVQKNEHSALDDAKWNKDLHVFLQSL